MIVIKMTTVTYCNVKKFCKICNSLFTAGPALEDKRNIDQTCLLKELIIDNKGWVFSHDCSTINSVDNKSDFLAIPTL